jgi:hypothetical protein
MLTPTPAELLAHDKGQAALPTLDNNGGRSHHSLATAATLYNRLQSSRTARLGPAGCSSGLLRWGAWEHRHCSSTQQGRPPVFGNTQQHVLPS